MLPNTMTASATATQLEKAPDTEEMTGRQLAEYVRGKLNLTLSLASQGEHERRSGRWKSAVEYQRQWEEAITEVKRLLPLVRASGMSLFATTESPRSQRHR